MKVQFKKPCRYPGCPGLTLEVFCEKHKAGIGHPCANQQCSAVAPYGKRFCPACEEKETAHYDHERGSAKARGYDKAWEKARAVYLAGHPLCEQCQEIGLVVPAVMVHHITPLRSGGARLDPANMQALCNPCHQRQHGHNRSGNRATR